MIVMKCLEKGKPTNFYVHDELKKNKDLMLKVFLIFENDVACEWISSYCLTDKDYYNKIISINPRAFDNLTIKILNYSPA